MIFSDLGARLRKLLSGPTFFDPYLIEFGDVIHLPEGWHEELDAR